MTLFPMWLLAPLALFGAVYWIASKDSAGESAIGLGEVQRALQKQYTAMGRITAKVDLLGSRVARLERIVARSGDSESQRALRR